MKKLVIFLIFVIIICMVIQLQIFSKNNKINTNFIKTGKVVYFEKTVCIEQSSLSLIIEIFNDKKLYKDNPSCGFRKDVAIWFNENEYFCIACDSCPIIYWENQNRYIRLNTEEYKLLNNLLLSYGFTFPCV